jgi:DNA adenine methylase
MKYLGGKSRLAGKFSNILNDAISRSKGNFYEPFVGGFNIVPHIDKFNGKIICSDIHSGLIFLYKSLDGGWLPPDNLSRDLYDQLKVNKRQDDALSVFTSFACSFGGKEWGGFANDGKGLRNYCKEGKSNLLKKLPHIKRCHFKNCSYSDLVIEPNSVVYCDPPYKNTTGYKTGDFDSDSFYNWCEQIVASGSEVFVSEFSAPDHWQVVWEKDRKISVDISNYKTKTDKLFKVLI